MSLTHKEIMIIAGEASGDQRGAEVAHALLQKEPLLKIYGIGGEEMRSIGVNTLYDVEELAVMGFIEPIKHLPRILHIFNDLKKTIINKKPDLIILVDYPGFNLRVAKFAKKHDIKVLFYISPQVWAWRQGRVKKIAKVVDHMAVIFPFEEQFYQKHNVPVTYVGHPLTQKIKRALTFENARDILGIKHSNKVVTLMPGSRYSEVNNLLPIMIQAAELIEKQNLHTEFVLAIASTIDKDKINQFLQASHLKIHTCSDSMTAVCASDAVITASGTATLETALLCKPMVIVYKVKKLTAMIAKRVIKIPFISLCNIVAGEEVVKEILQDDVTPESIETEITKILTDSLYREQIEDKLKTIKEKLGDLQAADNVANIALSMLQD